MKTIWKALITVLGTATLVAGCKEDAVPAEKSIFPPDSTLSFTAQDASNAMERIESLVQEYTPRDAGTPEGRRAAEWLHRALIDAGIESKIDVFDDPTPRGSKTFVNVIGELKGSGDEWIVLLSHFDTKSGISSDFQGANDSGSSTGLLLELASVIKEAGTKRYNFLFGFMDGEECQLAYSDRDGFHGSKKFAGDLKKKEVKIKAVILLDMVGDRDLKLTIPRNSSKKLKLLALKAAENTGHRDKIGLHDYNIYDDHQAFLDLGYPAINLIDFYFGSKPGSNEYWHTTEDSLDKLSTDSLLVTGEIVMEMINMLVH